MDVETLAQALQAQSHRVARLPGAVASYIASTYESLASKKTD